MLAQKQSSAIKWTILGGAALATAGILIFLRKHRPNGKLILIDPQQKIYSQEKINLKDGRKAILTIKEIEKVERIGFASMFDYIKKLRIANMSWQKEGSLTPQALFERFRVFSRGQIGAYIEIDGEEELVGMICSIRMNITDLKRDVPPLYMELVDKFLWLNRLNSTCEYIDNEKFTNIIREITEDFDALFANESSQIGRETLLKLRKARSMVSTLQVPQYVRDNIRKQMNIGLDFARGNTLICPRVDVLEEWQGYGIAKQLIRAQLQLAHNLGCTKIYAYSRAINFKQFNSTLAYLGLRTKTSDISQGLVVSFDDYLKLRKPYKTASYSQYRDLELLYALLEPTTFKPMQSHVEKLYDLYKFYMNNSWKADQENFERLYNRLFAANEEVIRDLLIRKINEPAFDILTVLFDYMNFVLRYDNHEYTNWRLYDMVVGMHCTNGGRIALNIEGSTPNDASGNRNTIVDYSHLL